ncbi:hypothetical protein GCM10010918_22890 [Paenibacillus radicis (ex Gao et al. 2016)]|uniref:Ribonuclease R n=2 Tax=Paenibacillus radicis (ex Gao et al. 2016) TaxID=1737354 RepID=A0A917H508_9BACL|nr:hypothetical protein GCM10010918_22890 [Paenibacillus radicis (ex Gao et al. 2016)]
MQEQELLDFMRETAYKPMTYQELEQHFGIANAAEFKLFLKMLNQLEEEGKVIRTRNERYGVPERMNLLRGKVQAHAKGFAFLLPDEKDHPDVYIHANDQKSAMNGDIVLVRITSQSESGGRLEGEVVRIVQRAVVQVVGTFENHESFGFVVPDDKRINRDIFIAKGEFQGAVTGQKVVARIVSYPEGRAAATGEIIEILGHKNDPGIDILSIIRKHQLPESFTDEVLAEAEAAPDSITEEEIIQQGRRDLRDEVIVTIDGEDAKDLDDAVHVKRLDNGNYLLGVHIADVGYYVTEKSELDQEAFRRGCSVYLVDRVIPMLPHRLSNGICSLNPQVDRLTLSCEMEFDAKTLKRVRHEVFTSVIKTKERMTYSNVRKLLTATEEEPETELKERYADLLDMFKLMEELAMRLRKKRMKRGAIDFDFQESKVIVDEQGKAVDIVKRERSVAEQIIEEFMLSANETVAEHFHWLRVPFLYRIHEDPDQEKLLHFMQFASNFGYVVKGKGNSVHPRALQTLLEEIHGTKEETVISTVMLRSMKQAKYDADCLGHFGLAAEFYTHFTSPIRRYPDLVIHRVIREVLENGGSLPEKRQEALMARMPDYAQHSSERERVAVDAERDTDKLKKCEFMLDKVGEEFNGIISSVTSFGMFVELDNTVEGLIRLSDLTDDYYHFHELHMVLIGERTSKVYRIGDEVKIRLARVNMEEYTMDFEMVDMKPRSGFKGVADAGFGVGRGAKKRGGFGRGGADDRGRGGKRGGGGDRAKGGVGALAPAKGGKGDRRGKGGNGAAGALGDAAKAKGGKGSGGNGEKGEGRGKNDSIALGVPRDERSGGRGKGVAEVNEARDEVNKNEGGKRRRRGAGAEGSTGATGTGAAAEGSPWQKPAEPLEPGRRVRGGKSVPRTDMWGLPIREGSKSWGGDTGEDPRSERRDGRGGRGGSGGQGGRGRSGGARGGNGAGGGGTAGPRGHAGSAGTPGGGRPKPAAEAQPNENNKQVSPDVNNSGEEGKNKKRKKKNGGGGGNATAAFVRKNRK